MNLCKIYIYNTSLVGGALENMSKNAHAQLC